jgi:hypothetical protein
VSRDLPAVEVDSSLRTQSKIDEQARRRFHEEGSYTARGLFDPAEAAFLSDHFMRLREAGAYPVTSSASTLARTTRSASTRA